LGGTVGDALPLVAADMKARRAAARASLGGYATSVPCVCVLTRARERPRPPPAFVCEYTHTHTHNTHTHTHALTSVANINIFRSSP